MLGLITPVYNPNDKELLLLKLMAEGSKPGAIQSTLGLLRDALNQMQSRLRLKLGVESNDQLMCEYGKYLARNGGRHPYDVTNAALQNTSPLKP